jgi:hypothetical protein
VIVASSLSSAPIGGRVRIGGKAHVSLGGSYSEGVKTPLDVTTRWVDGTAGFLVVQDVAESLAVVVRVEALVTHLATSLEDTTGSGSGGRTLGGSRVGVGGQLWLTPSLGIGLDGSAQWLAGSTDVSVDGSLAGSAAALGYVVHAGVLLGLL